MPSRVMLETPERCATPGLTLLHNGVEPNVANVFNEKCDGMEPQIVRSE
jgi:hypothetical protein